MTPMDFSGSYEGLIEKCELVAVAMTRDLTELAAYNITAGVVSVFIDETEAFDLLPNDNLLESLQMTAPPTAAPTGLQVNMMTLLLTWLAVAGRAAIR